MITKRLNRILPSTRSLTFCTTQRFVTTQTTPSTNHSPKHQPKRPEAKEIEKDSLKSEYVQTSNLVDEKMRLKTTSTHQDHTEHEGKYNINKELKSDKKDLSGNSQDNKEQNEKCLYKKGKQDTPNYDVDPGAG